MTEGSTWAFSMPITMCFQFSMLNIYHPYGYQLMSLKGESHYAMSRLFFRGLVAVVTVGLMGNALVLGTATVRATVQDAMEMQCHPC